MGEDREMDIQQGQFVEVRGRPWLVEAVVRRAVGCSEETSPLFGMALQRRLHRVVPFSWSSPRPRMRGQWLGSTPAGCEVCRGSPAENESPTLDRDLPKLALDGETIM